MVILHAFNGVNPLGFPEGEDIAQLLIQRGKHISGFFHANYYCRLHLSIGVGWDETVQFRNSRDHPFFHIHCYNDIGKGHLVLTGGKSSEKVQLVHIRFPKANLQNTVRSKLWGIPREV